MSLKAVDKIIKECSECNITSRSIYMMANTNIGAKSGIRWISNNDINKIKIYFLYEFLIHSTLFLNMFKQTPKLRNEFINSIERDSNLLDLNEYELSFINMFNSINSLKNYDEIVDEIKKIIEFMNSIGYNLSTIIFDDRVEAYKHCLEMEKEYSFDIEFKKVLLEYDKNLVDVK